MNKLVLIYNYFIEDHYGAEEVLPFSSNRHPFEVKGLIEEFVDDLRNKTEQVANAWNRWHLKDRQIKEESGYDKLYQEYRTLLKSINVAKNNTPKIKRDAEFAQKILKLEDAATELSNKLEAIGNSDTLPESPDNKLIISDTCVLQINIEKYSSNTFDILTLEEWFDRRSYPKHSITVK